MFNILIDTDRPHIPYRLNSREIVLSETSVRSWHSVFVPDFRHLTYTCDQHFNNFALSGTLKEWLEEHCKDSWRCWYDAWTNSRALCFLFRDAQAAMLFKLTWV